MRCKRGLIWAEAGEIRTTAAGLSVLVAYGSGFGEFARAWRLIRTLSHPRTVIIDIASFDYSHEFEL